MIHINLKDGGFEILRDDYDFKSLVHEVMGSDAGEVVAGLIAKSDKAAKDEESDIRSYEMSLAERDMLLRDTLDSLKAIQEELKKYRTDKQKLLAVVARNINNIYQNL